MITLNKDYSEVEKQTQYIKKHLNYSFHPLKNYIYRELYEDLRDSISEKENLKLNGDIHFIQLYLGELSHLNCNRKLKWNFWRNDTFHKEYLDTCYLEVSQLLAEIKENYSFPSPTIFKRKSNKVEELVIDFLKEEDYVLYHIFQDMCQSKRIYYNNQDKDAFVIYNELQGISNIFLPVKHFTISKLSDLIHELGHVKDFMEVPAEKLLTYETSSLYQEVWSYYYEQRFLTYLVETNQYRSDAKRVMVKNIEVLKETLQDDKKMLNKAQYDMDGLFEDMQYSYGMVLPSLLDSFQKIEQFRTFQYDYFNYRKLEKMGITSQNAVYSYKRQMKDMMKR